jgi:hypothetical protein
MTKLTANNMDSWFETVWNALHDYREQCAPAEIDGLQFPENDEAWDDICTAMAWIAEAAGHEMEMDP